MKTMVEYVHQRILSYPKNLIGVDFTMGNGNDTVFLQKHCQKVYAFDIQKEAFENTKKKLETTERIHFICDGHENLAHYLSSFDIGVFNLGYLPLANHCVTTLLDTTKIAVEQAIMRMQYVLFIVVYPGHDEGKKESQWIDGYVSSLDAHQFHVSTYRMMNKHLSPYVIEIERKNKYHLE